MRNLEQLQKALMELQSKTTNPDPVTKGRIEYLEGRIQGTIR